MDRPVYCLSLRNCTWKQVSEYGFLHHSPGTWILEETLTGRGLADAKTQQNMKSFRVSSLCDGWPSGHNGVRIWEGFGYASKPSQMLNADCCTIIFFNFHATFERMSLANQSGCRFAVDKNSETDSPLLYCTHVFLYLIFSLEKLAIVDHTVWNRRFFSLWHMCADFSWLFLHLSHCTYINTA